MYGIWENGKLLARFVVPLQMVSNQPVMTSDALSLKRVSTVRSSQRWELSAKLEPLSSGANELFALFIRKGYTDPISISVPQNYGVIKARSLTASSPIATGTKLSETISVSNNVGTIPVGTFVKFANHDKVYMLTGNLVNSGTVGVYPSLRANVSSESMHHREDVFMNVYKDTDSIRGMQYDDGILMDLGQLKFIEKL